MCCLALRWSLSAGDRHDAIRLLSILGGLEESSAVRGSHAFPCKWIGLAWVLLTFASVSCFSEWNLLLRAVAATSTSRQKQLKVLG